MDKEQAKFILCSFRPDGQDSTDADFKEALQLAVEDRGLGEWLADERAADAEFAAALCEIEIPEQLRLSLLAVMRGESPEDPSLHKEMDNLLSGALAGVEPPSGLRDQIIAAMEVEKTARNQEAESKVIPGVFNRRKWLGVAAVAAALVLGAFLAFQVNIGGETKTLASYEIQQTAGRVLNAGITFDMADSNSTHLTSWLAEHKLPTLASVSELPPGLRGMKSRGCKKIKLAGGKVASMVCFVVGEKKTAHLVIVNNEDVSDLDLPSTDRVSISDCYNCSVTQYNVVRWRDDKHTFILLAKADAVSKSELINYF